MALPAAKPRSADARVRGALLMPLCALAVHQLRYYLAFGGSAQSHLAHDGHAYLAAVEPFALLATTAALGLFLGRLVRTLKLRPAVAPGRGRSIQIWALCALALFAIYCGQELFEGLFASGHPAGVAGVLGHGGWVAAPAAIVVGAALAATLRLSEALIGRVATRREPSRRTPAAPARRPRPRSHADWRLDPQRGVVAGRAPPRAPSFA